MNILFFADNFPPECNAAASRVYERACYWRQWGHGVTVITCAPNFPEGKLYPGYRNSWCSQEEMNGIRVIRVKTFIAPNQGAWLRILDFLSYMLSAFAAALFLPRPDVVAATSPQFFAALCGWALAAVRRLPFVFELSDLWPASIAAVGAMKPGIALRWVEKVELFLYRRASLIVALTESFRADLIRRGIPSWKISVVINGVDLSRYAPVKRDAELALRWGIGGDDFVIGYVGTLGMAHGLENALGAAALLLNRKVRFIFVGTGADRENLIRLASERCLDNVTFIPPQPKENIPSYWGLCDAALVQLRDSAVFCTVIPSKIFEAMAMGLPILFSGPPCDGSRIVEREGAGICIAPGNPGALAEAATALRDNPAWKSALAARSLSAAGRYTRERQAKEMIGVLEQAAQSSSLAALARGVAGSPAASEKAKCSP